MAWRTVSRCWSTVSIRCATSGREMVRPWRTLRSVAVRYVPVSGPLVSRGGRIVVQSRFPFRSWSSIAARSV